MMNHIRGNGNVKNQGFVSCGKMLLLAVLLTIVGSGCAEPLTAYRASGHDCSAAKKVLILPFLDARTFREEGDESNENISILSRDHFRQALCEHPGFKDKVILTPDIKRPAKSLTTEQALSYGWEYKADLVVAGQIFSYNSTRAASIAPRAGMFVRIFSVPEDRLVFVGDHYQAAGGPGAAGGRERQADEVARAILNSYAAGAGDSNAGSEEEPVAKATVVKIHPDNAPAVLFLPFNEADNPHNLIESTGGGAVVTSIFEMELAKRGQYRLISPKSDQVDFSKMLPVDKALALARSMGADYVMRGQVVEFRRAASVPSLYSAIISTALLAAQLLFAERSGVDIATEIWRVEDGKCIYSSREVFHQKYVVQAEKTVRRVASYTIEDVVAAMSNPKTAPVEPVIDRIVIPKRNPLENKESAVAASSVKKDATPSEKQETPPVVTDRNDSAEAVAKDNSATATDDAKVPEAQAETNDGGKSEEKDVKAVPEESKDDVKPAVSESVEEKKPTGDEDKKEPEAKPVEPVSAAVEEKNVAEVAEKNEENIETAEAIVEKPAVEASEKQDASKEKAASEVKDQKPEAGVVAAKTEESKDANVSEQIVEKEPIENPAKDESAKSEDKKAAKSDAEETLGLDEPLSKPSPVTPERRDNPFRAQAEGTDY